MSDLSFSSVIRDLSNDYYNLVLSKESYRQQRKEILDKIDEEYNGRKQDVSEKTENMDFMKTVSFISNKNIDD